jgi:cytochrome d ubiquinol oxidase subunit II
MVVSSALFAFAAAQFPYLVIPTLSIYSCASSNAVLNYLIAALSVGALTLFPSLFILFRVFKGTGKHSTLTTPLEE